MGKKRRLTVTLNNIDPLTNLWIIYTLKQSGIMEGIMYFKKLIGKKCYLSPIDVNDAEKFTEWLNDMEILVNLQLYGGVISLENERTFLSDLSKGHNYSIIDFRGR